MSAKVCPECGDATLRIEFRDQFLKTGERFNQRANGMWIVCAGCQHEWQPAASQPEETT